MLELDTEFARMTALWRWYENALDKATLIIAISRSHLIDREDLFCLDLRQTTMQIDLLHEFAFLTRKAIERAEQHAPGILDYARQLVVHHPWIVKNLTDEWSDCPALTDQKFWWIANRIVHSRETMVHHRATLLPVEQWPTPSMLTSERSPICFGFQSDYDEDRNMHFVHIESFVRAYVGALSPKVEDAIRRRNRIPGHDADET